MDSSHCSELLDQFSPDYNDLVAYGQMHGVEALNGMLDILGGQKPHIPMRGNFWAGLAREIRDEEIRARHNGRNYQQLGLEYDLDERQVRRIVHREPRRYAQTGAPPRPMKVRESHHRQITRLAERYQRSLFDVLDTVLEAALQDEAISTRIAEQLGGSMEMMFG